MSRIPHSNSKERNKSPSRPPSVRLRPTTDPRPLFRTDRNFAPRLELLSALKLRSYAARPKTLPEFSAQECGFCGLSKGKTIATVAAQLYNELVGKL